MSQIVSQGFTFIVADEVLAKYPELVDLVLNSESITENNERQYWFDILPAMTDEQIDRLFTILITEKQQLEELNLKYHEEIKTLNEKHIIQWQALQSKKTKEQIREAEKQDTSAQDASAALDQLNAL